uniref:ribosomal protein S9 n=1 Tax=Hyalomonas oviformis TaxID=40531 RepID=UPI00226CE36E|nr:ribosomal protein S9 [Hyalomonas oviformis]UZA61988.1 ribosomal protein S9 [Hyalomonas oviformis]
MEILARSVGRRKESVAIVKIVRGTGQFIINNQSAQDYLNNNSSSLISIKSPFDVLTKEENKKNELLPLTLESFDTIVKVKGGGLMGQSDAIKLAVARALCNLPALAPTIGVDCNAQPAAVVEKQGVETLNNEDSLNNNNEDSLNNNNEDSLNNNNEDSFYSSSYKEEVKSTLVPLNNSVRKLLKTKGYLTQDSRVKERRKYGLKKARKASQYHKR